MRYRLETGHKRSTLLLTPLHGPRKGSARRHQPCNLYHHSYRISRTRHPLCLKLFASTHHGLRLPEPLQSLHGSTNNTPIQCISLGKTEVFICLILRPHMVFVWKCTYSRSDQPPHKGSRTPEFWDPSPAPIVMNSWVLHILTYIYARHTFSGQWRRPCGGHAPQQWRA
jgi:hypothetical protein